MFANFIKGLTRARWMLGDHDLDRLRMTARYQAACAHVLRELVLGAILRSLRRIAQGEGRILNKCD